MCSNCIYDFAIDLIFVLVLDRDGKWKIVKEDQLRGCMQLRPKDKIACYYGWIFWFGSCRCWWQSIHFFGQGLLFWLSCLHSNPDANCNSCSNANTFTNKSPDANAITHCHSFTAFNKNTHNQSHYVVNAASDCNALFFSRSDVFACNSRVPPVLGLVFLSPRYFSRQRFLPPLKRQLNLHLRRFRYWDIYRQILS
jgi:hypothetical protein